MGAWNEERLASLLRLLPPAPPAWVQAAQELPAARAALDELAARAQADRELREALIRDLEAALEQEGVEAPPGPLVVARHTPGIRIKPQGPKINRTGTSAVCCTAYPCALFRIPG